MSKPLFYWQGSRRQIQARNLYFVAAVVLHGTTLERAGMTHGVTRETVRRAVWLFGRKNWDRSELEKSGTTELRQRKNEVKRKLAEINRIF